MWWEFGGSECQDICAQYMLVWLMTFQRKTSSLSGSGLEPILSYILTKKSACVSPVPRELEGDSRVADNLFGRETLKSC